MHTNWIWRDNLIPVLDLLVSLVGHQLDSEDTGAVLLGICGTDADAGRWFEYEFSGSSTLKIWVADDIGSDVRMLRVESVPLYAQDVRTIFDVAQRYRLSVA
ncbi:MAG: hypothetical protein RL693_206 [Verrucomicrobiota bacterium]|jgi:hypothetical protein